MDASEKRCPVCGRGELVDLLYTEGSPRDDPRQGSDTRQVEVYSCGHERVGPRLDESATQDGELEAERRTAEETVDPPPEQEPQ